MKRLFVWCRCGYAHDIELGSGVAARLSHLAEIHEVSCSTDAWYRDYHRAMVAAGRNVGLYVHAGLAALRVGPC